MPMNPRATDLLKGKLSKAECALLPSSYDMVGSLLLFSDFPKGLVKKEKMIAGAFLESLPHIRTVLRKTKNFSGKYRLPKYKIIGGEKTKETLYKENNVRLKLNVEKTYFSSRLATERLRISNQVKKGESVLIMFSGAAPYPIVLSKNSNAKEIIGVELNPAAHKYGLENVALNKITNVQLIKGDVKKIVPKLKKKFDRIAMPLPKGAENFLDVALKAIGKNGIIHFYDFLHENEFDKAEEKIKKACKKSKRKCEIVRIVKCGQHAPYVFRICADVKIK